jgi:valyl-tRNA synthetase
VAEIAAPDAGAAAVLAVTTQVLGEVRRAKSEAKRPLKVSISRAVVRDTPERLARLEQARADLCSAANIESLLLEQADSFALQVEFQEPGAVA